MLSTLPTASDGLILHKIMPVDAEKLQPCASDRTPSKRLRNYSNVPKRHVGEQTRLGVELAPS